MTLVVVVLVPSGLSVTVVVVVSSISPPMMSPKVERSRVLYNNCSEVLNQNLNEKNWREKPFFKMTATVLHMMD